VKLLDVHVAMLLPGSVVLTLYGALYRLWPAMKGSPFARAQFWLANFGVFGIVTGAGWTVLGGSPVIAGTGAALVILGAVLMTIQFWTHAEA
jgi:hypothetical protein